MKIKGKNNYIYISVYFLYICIVDLINLLLIKTKKGNEKLKENQSAAYLP